jgi:hypothetical protein
MVLVTLLNTSALSFQEQRNLNKVDIHARSYIGYLQHSSGREVIAPAWRGARYELNNGRVQQHRGPW